MKIRSSCTIHSSLQFKNSEMRSIFQNHFIQRTRFKRLCHFVAMNKTRFVYVVFPDQKQIPNHQNSDKDNSYIGFELIFVDSQKNKSRKSDKQNTSYQISRIHLSSVRF